MEYNVVTNRKIINEVKKYKHFIVSLGYANYTGVEDKKLSDKDKFAYFYNTKYSTTIFGQGIIGNINFYLDHYIIEDQIAIYFNKEEFAFKFEWDKVKEKGIEWYLGSLLKRIKDKLEIKEETKEGIDITKKGDPYKVINNPGAVTFEDIKAYQEAKRKGLI